MYRPQFVFPRPAGVCDAQRCHYSYDGSNTPVLVSVAAGAVLTKIPLRMDQDAPFFLRAVQFSNTALLLRLEDAFDNPLLTESLLVNADLWGGPGGGGLVAADSDEWGIYCPAGSVLLLYVQNATGGAVTDLVVNLHGVKWYSEAACS